MKLNEKLLAAAGVLALAGQNVMAQTVDYSDLTEAVNFTAIIPVVLGVAAVIVAFTLVKNNIGTIMRFVRGQAK